MTFWSGFAFWIIVLAYLWLISPGLSRYRVVDDLRGISFSEFTLRKAKYRQAQLGLYRGGKNFKIFDAWKGRWT